MSMRFKLTFDSRLDHRFYNKVDLFVPRRIDVAVIAEWIPTLATFE